MVNEIIFIRGASGSGKTHDAKKIQKKRNILNKTCVVLSIIPSLDDHNRQARNQLACGEAMKQKYNTIIIDAINGDWMDLEPYIYLAKKHQYIGTIFDTTAKWRKDADLCYKHNINNTPKFVIQRQLAKIAENSLAELNLRIYEFLERKIQ